VLAVGFDGRAIPSVVLGLAMVLLGTLRIRDYVAARRSRT
jgi:hypothetical protein